MMTEPEILQAQAAMGLIGRVAESIDWKAYLETISHAETIGPFVDPTAWIRSPHKLREQTTELASILLQLVAQWRKCKAELDATLAREMKS